MNKLITERVNGYGAILRFITPILIMALGYLMNMGICDIRNKIEKMDRHFTNHLEHHQDLEVGYERRLTCMETRMNNYHSIKEN
jgi:hypothetical protein